MSVYSYSAKNTKGQERRGTIEAKSKLEAASQLRSRGFVPVKIEEKRVARDGSGAEGNLLKQILNFNVGKVIDSFRGVALSDKIIFSRHLGVMLSAGVPITRALEILRKQTKNTHFQNVISKIEGDIRRGSSVADAFGGHSDTFSSLYVSMVRSGDSAGNLIEVLDVLADQLKKEHDLKSRIRGAMMYPAVVVAAMAGIGVLMMVSVVPKISEIFEDLGVELPLLTKIVIVTSNFVADYWIFIFGSLPLVFYALKKLASTREGRVVLSRVYLSVPVLRGLTKKINSAYFARTLSSLIKGGVPIVEGFEITADTLTNHYYKASMKKIREDIKKGESIFKSMQKFSDIYPGLIVQMVRVGEESGSLSETLATIADFYEEEVNNATKNLSSLIEPVLMIIIGIIVGIFAISMIQPMYSLMGNL